MAYKWDGGDRLLYLVDDPLFFGSDNVNNDGGKPEGDGLHPVTPDLCILREDLRDGVNYQLVLGFEVSREQLQPDDV